MIHEMTEMMMIDMGQYAHGNQPVHHMIYLYNYAGEPWKTQKWAREVMRKLYNAGPDGYCGRRGSGADVGLVCDQCYGVVCRMSGNRPVCHR